MTGRALTNDRKREEMAQIVGDAIARGWTAPALAAYLDVAASTIGAWKRGASMGTNAQRRILRAMNSPSIALPAAIVNIRSAAEREERVLERYRADPRVVASGHLIPPQERRIAFYRARLAVLEGLQKEVA